MDCPVCKSPLTDLKCSRGCTTKLQSLCQTDTITQKEKILYLIEESPNPLSRNDIESLLHMRLSAVCGRVNELLQANDIIVAGRKWDENTSRIVETLTAKKEDLAIWDEFRELS